MIPLRLAIDPFPIDSELVVRLTLSQRKDRQARLGRDALLVSYEAGVAEYDVSGVSLRVSGADPHSTDGDVLLILPGARSAHRLLRERSSANTFLVTEQCDQKCIMCSQPPKTHHLDMFQSFGQAIELAPEGITIGLSGGEPLLHKAQLFELLIGAKKRRPDLRFHVLTNGQHFEATDLGTLGRLGDGYVLWGVPVYAADASLHDLIVEKPGAFARLNESFSLLARAGAEIELRTVVLRSNAHHLEDLAEAITRNLSFAGVWALMQLENIGYGRMNWGREFFDNSIDFNPIAKAIDLALGRGVPVSLYNFPSCTVPQSYRDLCRASISDWKQKFLPVCSQCSIREACSGFFEWSPAAGGFSVLRSL